MDGKTFSYLGEIVSAVKLRPKRILSDSRLMLQYHNKLFSYDVNNSRKINGECHRSTYLFRRRPITGVV